MFKNISNSYNIFVKSISTILVLLTVASIGSILPVSCSQKESEPHIHKWSERHQDSKEHWRNCTSKDCDEPGILEKGEHVGYPCEICGPAFKAVAFYTGINDMAHVSFCKEANTWFSSLAKNSNFIFESTTDWSNLNDEFLEDVDVLFFYDTRPEDESQREAFQRYMENGGAWIGFHFAAFALTPSTYPQNWDWYHDEFLGSGQYVSNTWEPTTAILKVEDKDSYITYSMPSKFKSTPCEWYRWEHDLRENKDIDILCSIDPSSFPLGNKEGEIWYEGYYPVVWTNTNYNMLYMNMGHNLVNYNNGDTHSYTFGDETQNKLIYNFLDYLRP